ncbi:MAG TPA: hypothetical protein H9694_11580 [Firmicutes bacterium]|nr:hypothetical protein [Bacillota bacterium]
MDRCEACPLLEKEPKTEGRRGGIACVRLHFQTAARNIQTKEKSKICFERVIE